MRQRQKNLTPANRRRTQWSEERITQFKALAETKIEAKEIAKAMGLRRAQITNAAKRFSVETGKKKLPIPAGGDLLSMMKWVFANRILERIVRNKNDCFIWQGAKSNYGYGQVVIYGKKLNVSRLALQVSQKAIMTGDKFCLHRCDTPSCCNPDHLFWGTQSDNMRDAMSKSRVRGHFKKGHISENQVRGESCSTAKMTQETVMEARRVYDNGEMGHRRLAKKYGISRAAMLCVVKRKTWRHVA